MDRLIRATWLFAPWLLAAGLMGCSADASPTGTSAPLDSTTDSSCGYVGCVLTQGFWKTHPEAWPVSQLKLGCTTYCEGDLLDLLHTPVKGDASLILAHQLIATKLNIAAGAKAPPKVIKALCLAKSLLCKLDSERLPYCIGPSTRLGSKLVQLSRIFDAFNEGKLGVPSCDD